MKYLEGLYKISFPMVKNKILNKLFFAWNYLVIRAFMRKTYPLFCRLKKCDTGVSNEKYEKEIIVSMTSFPPRMNTIRWTLESVIRQSMKPNRIEIWLCEEEFPDREIPEVLKEFEKKGVEVFFTPLNLKPHKKCFHTAQHHKNSIIITLDDDILYSEDVVKRLYEGYLQSDRHSVICELAHEMLLTEDGRLKRYEEWNCEAKGIKGPSNMLMAIGAGGILYPAGFFSDDYFDMKAIKDCCLMADDLWLKFVGIRNQYPVLKTKRYAKNVYCVKGSQAVSLSEKNNGKGQNNISLSRLVEKYKDDIAWRELR